jgi:hypothetical protein
MMSSNDCFLKASQYRAQAHESNERLEHVLLLEASQRWWRMGEIAVADEVDQGASSSKPKEGTPRFGFWSLHRLYRKRGMHHP